MNIYLLFLLVEMAKIKMGPVVDVIKLFLEEI